MTKSEKDFQDSIETLRHLSEMYHSGKKVLYKSVATELRKLLCDTRLGKDNSLIPRVRPAFKLRRLMNTDLLEGTSMDPDVRPLPSGEGTTFTLPIEIRGYGDGTYDSKLSIYPKAIYMDIDAWVGQRILNRTTTVGSLIKSVADKEGAHSDPDYNETLRHSNRVRIVGDQGTLPYIIGIAEYLLEELQEQDAL